MDAMALYECAIETVDYILYMILIECVRIFFVSFKIRIVAVCLEVQIIEHEKTSK